MQIRASASWVYGDRGALLTMKDGKGSYWAQIFPAHFAHNGYSVRLDVLLPAEPLTRLVEELSNV